MPVRSDTLEQLSATNVFGMSGTRQLDEADEIGLGAQRFRTLMEGPEVFGGYGARSILTSKQTNINCSAHPICLTIFRTFLIECAAKLWL